MNAPLVIDRGRKAIFSMTSLVNDHLQFPGYVEKADELKASGIKEIVCVSVNDPFVMAAWGEAQVRGINFFARLLYVQLLDLLNFY